jgi:hypothetical protein
MDNKGTYDRKYYLHRRIKSAGFRLQLEHMHKTIVITPDQVEPAKQDKYVAELQKQYSYGVQILNPMVK